ncbi:MAG TPA: NTP transferase domain-containing protein [Polyangia bacterium]|nr:NTP transferase domain-containing protein [Polyangia bacterium]
MSRSEATVVAVVQARISSRRLPGKVLADIGGRPALAWVFERLRRANELESVILATSDGSDDDPVAELGERCGVAVHRGPLEDVLGRFIGAVAPAGAEAVVRITGDCPLVEPALVDRLVRIWRGGDADYVANVIEPRSFPKGLDAEVVSVDALRAAAAAATAAADREHVTSFVRDNPDRFPARGLWMTPQMEAGRVTLDTADDLEQLRSLLPGLGLEAGLGAIVAALGGPSDPAVSELPPPAAAAAR